MSENQVNLYPKVTIGLNANPNKLYAIPFFGALIKIVILIPVFLVLLGLSIAAYFLVLINSLMVLFTGKYWDVAYNLMLASMRYTAKASFFMTGMTDTYPGFDFQIHDSYTIDLAYPQNPNRLFAVPFFGGFVRILIMIPFSIYTNVISSAASLGVFFLAWAFVLFTGKYPEALHELYRDSFRLSLASSAYLAGLSDKYPSFWISMNHKNVKIVLIVIAAIMMFFQYMNAFSKDRSTNPAPYQYQNQSIQQLPTQDQSSDSNYQ